MAISSQQARTINTCCHIRLSCVAIISLNSVFKLDSSIEEFKHREKSSKY